MRNIFFTIAVSGIALLSAGPVLADESTDMVVQKMAEGDVAAICGDGIGGINKAATAAITSLAQAGKLSGDFAVIGQEAGGLFYQLHCS